MTVVKDLVSRKRDADNVIIEQLMELEYFENYYSKLCKHRGSTNPNQIAGCLNDSPGSNI